MQRSFDQISHDLALNHLPGTILVYGASIHGMNDESHLGIFDIPFWHIFPTLFILRQPLKKNIWQCWIGRWNKPTHQLRSGYRLDLSTKRQWQSLLTIAIKKNEVTQAGTQVAIVGVGNFYALAEEIAEQLKMQHGITPTVINPKFISGVDKELLDAVARSHKLVVTLEDGIREGGYGQMIASYLGDREIAVKNYGLEKKFYDNYRAADVLSELGITAEAITKDVMEQLQKSIH